MRHIRDVSRNCDMTDPAPLAILGIAVETPQHAGLASCLDYTSEQTLAPGTLVRVPLGKRDVPGIVWHVGPGSAAVALLDELDGQAFIQPVGRNAALTINDQPLTATRRLAAGDVIGFYGSRVLIREEQTALVCEIRLEDSAYVTRPPDVAATDGRAPEELIAPTVFQRKREVGIVEDRPPKWRWQSGVAAGIGLLIGMLISRR